MSHGEKYGLMDFFKFYRAQDKYARKAGLLVSYKIYSGILKDFNKMIATKIIEDSTEFKMPLRLGSLRIRKYKKTIHVDEAGNIDKSKIPVDWNTTRKLWQKEYPGKSMEELKLIQGKPLVYFLNEHTEGYMFMLYWNKKGSNAINRSVYSIKMTRTNNRNLARAVKEKQVNFYQ